MTRYDYQQFVVTKDELDSEKKEYKNIKINDDFLKSSTPATACETHFDSYKKLKDEDLNNAAFLSLLTCIEIWIKTHISVFRYLKRIDLHKIRFRLPIEVFRVIYGKREKENEKPTFEHLKKTISHDLDAMIITLVFFTGPNEKLFDLQKILQKCNQNPDYDANDRSTWVEGRYNTKRFDGIDLGRLEAAFKGVKGFFENSEIDVFKTFEGEI